MIKMKREHFIPEQSSLPPGKSEMKLVVPEVEEDKLASKIIFSPMSIDQRCICGWEHQPDVPKGFEAFGYPIYCIRDCGHVYHQSCLRIFLTDPTYRTLCSDCASLQLLWAPKGARPLTFMNDVAIWALDNTTFNADTNIVARLAQIRKRDWTEPAHWSKVLVEHKAKGKNNHRKQVRIDSMLVETVRMRGAKWAVDHGWVADDEAP